jgi:plastocyanin
VRNGRSRSLAGVYAAASALAATAVLGVAGVAGADSAGNADVYARDANNVLCFSTDAAAANCTSGEKANVTIAPGDTVTWHFDGSAYPHNAADADNATPTWKVPDSGFVVTGTYPRTFDTDGVYKFHCQAHPQMEGTVTVGTATPSPSPSATPTPTPTPSPQASGGGITTPPPAAGGDTVKPRIGGVRLTALHRAVRVRFGLSEAATVTVRVKRAFTGEVLKSARIQARAGTRTLTLRSNRLKKGRYTVDLQARDAFGNRSSLAAKRLTVRG